MEPPITSAQNETGCIIETNLSYCPFRNRCFGKHITSLSATYFRTKLTHHFASVFFFGKKYADTYRPKYKGHKTYKRTQAKSYVVVYRVRILKHTLKNNSGKFFYSMRNGTTSKLWKWIKTVMVKLLPVVSEITKVDQFQFTLSFNFLVTDRIWMGELESLGEPWVCVQNRGSWRINNPKVEGLMEARTQYKSSLD